MVLVHSLTRPSDSSNLSVALREDLFRQIALYWKLTTSGAELSGLFNNIGEMKIYSIGV